MKKQKTENLEQKEEIKIDWEQVKAKREEKKDEAEVPAISEKEKLAEAKKNAELLAEYHRMIDDVDKPKSEFATKDEIKEELHRKFEKGKLRPANLITMIFLIIAGSVLAAELLFLAGSIFLGFINNLTGFGGMFSGGSDIGSLLGSLGFFIYFAILLAGVGLCAGGIICIVLSIKDTARLNFLKDKDYMLNLYIRRITMVEILPLIPFEFIMIFILPFAKFEMIGILGYVMFVNIPLGVVHAGCLISILIQALVARIRFKKSVSPEEYKQIVSEKRRLLRKDEKRRSYTGAGRLY